MLKQITIWLENSFRIQIFTACLCSDNIPWQPPLRINTPKVSPDSLVRKSEKKYPWTRIHYLNDMPKNLLYSVSKQLSNIFQPLHECWSKVRPISVSYHQRAPKSLTVHQQPTCQKVLFSHSTSSSGGVCICFRYDLDYKTFEVINDKDSRHIIVRMEI